MVDRRDSPSTFRGDGTPFRDRQPDTATEPEVHFQLIQRRPSSRSRSRRNPDEKRRLYVGRRLRAIDREEARIEKSPEFQEFQNVFHQLQQLDYERTHLEIERGRGRTSNHTAEPSIPNTANARNRLLLLPGAVLLYTALRAHDIQYPTEITIIAIIIHYLFS